MSLKDFAAVFGGDGFKAMEEHVYDGNTRGARLARVKAALFAYKKTPDEPEAQYELAAAGGKCLSEFDGIPGTDAELKAVVARLQAIIKGLPADIKAGAALIP